MVGILTYRIEFKENNSISIMFPYLNKELISETYLVTLSYFLLDTMLYTKNITKSKGFVVGIFA